jgi:hypothetical protein
MSQTRKVFKYDLPLTSAPSEAIPFKLPAGSKILKVAEQGIDPMLGPHFCVWALVDPSENLEELRYVVTAGTGHEIALTTLSDKDWEFNDSVLAMGGRFVLHVWISYPEGKGGSEVAADNV